MKNDVCNWVGVKCLLFSVNHLKLAFAVLAISECQGNKLLCDVNADCKKSGASYTCTCKEGYFENGDSCTGLMCWLCLSLWTRTFLIYVTKFSVFLN